MAYSGRVEQIFHRALLAAFDRATLEQFLVVRMDVELENVVRRGNFSDETWDLLRWADREDRLKELMEKAGAEVPANPLLKEALTQLEPQVLENRWFAKPVPLATWILWLISACLAVALFKVWLINLIDLRRLFLLTALLVLVAGAGWLLYQRLVGGAIRSFAGLLLLRRLIAHTRLQRGDWLAFAFAAIVCAGLALSVYSGPRPVTTSFQTDGVGRSWRLDEFEVMKAFDTPPNMEPQNASRGGAASFSRTFYRVDTYIGSVNTARPIKIRIDLLPPGARDPDDHLTNGSFGVTFAVVAFDRALAQIARERESRPEFDQQLRISDQTIEFNQLSLEQLKGFRTILFTCQRNVDAQPNPRELTVVVRLVDPTVDSVVSSDRRTFKLEGWKTSAGEDGDALGAPQPDRDSGERAARRLAAFDSLLRLPVSSFAG